MLQRRNIYNRVTSLPRSTGTRGASCLIHSGLWLLFTFMGGIGLHAQSATAGLPERVQKLERQVTDFNRRLGITPAESQQAGGVALETRVALLEAQLAQLLAEFPGNAEGAAESDLPSNNVSNNTLPSQKPAVPLLRKLTTAEREGSETRLPIAGYMEMNFTKPEAQTGTLDFRRFVLLFGHSFSDRLKFWSELEIEHAFVEGLEEKGELELEQAYLDFLVHPALNFRGGMLLTPMGILNERHEPPSFYGVLRPQVDTVIIPSTWFDTGIGIFGDLGNGLSYKFYGMAPLDAAGFSAAEGLRGGRQKGSRSLLQNWAQALRLEYRGVRRLVLGSSFWNGKTGFDLPNVNPVVRLYEFDGRYRWNPFEFRGQFASSFTTQAGELNRALQRRTGISPNVAKQARGFYIEGAAHLLPQHSEHDLVGFVRYENFDTQHRMPRGFLPLKQFDRSLWTLGATYYPHPDIALKADYQIHRNESQVVKAANQFNLGLGWWF